MSLSIQLVKTHEIHATIELRTGLRIGASRDTIQIGGVDNPVIRHPHSQEPYIPGSSLKGKLRTMLEWALGKVDDRQGTPWSGGAVLDQNDAILRIFGTTSDRWLAGPTRVIFRDAPLSAAWRDRVLNNNLPWTEEKQEVVIDRIRGKAAGTGPRTMERVPAGAEFDLRITFREFAVGSDGGQVDRGCFNRLLEGLKLLERDYLGGSGSRGYGQIRVKNLSRDGQSIQQAFDGMGPFSKAAPNDIAGFGES